MSKVHTFKVWLTLKSGAVVKAKCKCTEDNIASTLQHIDEAWADSNQVGHINFKGNFISIQEVAHYRVKKVLF